MDQDIADAIGKWRATIVDGHHAMMQGTALADVVAIALVDLRRCAVALETLVKNQPGREPFP